VVAVLFNAGAHVPVIPLLDVVGNGASTAPEQIAATGVKVGVTLGVTVTVAVATVGQPQEFVTVNVYVVVLAGQALGFKIFVADKPAKYSD